jgi:UDP-N-acetylglucosamine 2-epimerase (non-hydrolysing)
LKKLKVVTIVGTRPEIIRLSRLIPKLDEYTDHILVHTGQNSDRQLNEVFFEDLELRQPDYYLNVDTSSMGSVMGDVLKKSEEVFIKEKPDAVMILGDTNSAIAAVVAERMHVPVYHMEAGNRSFDANVPEELNRKMVDHVATFNLPYNDYSMRNLLAEGIHPRFIQKTGSPIREIYEHYKAKIAASSALESLDLREGAYFLVSIHRQENVDRPERLSEVLECLQALRQRFGFPVLVSTHPRTKARLDLMPEKNFEGILFHEPFGYLDYNYLQAKSFCVVSDSGTISEESAVIGFSAVSIRDSIERPEAIETGSMLLTGLHADNLVQAVEIATRSQSERVVPEGYEVSDFSDRVLRFLASTARLHGAWANLRT